MGPPPRLADTFLACAGAPAGPSAALEARLSELWEAGRTAWPMVSLPAVEFVRHLAECLADQAAGGDPARLLDDLNAGDLYLACACARGVPEALAAFDRGLLGRVPAFLAHMGQPPWLAEEVKQVLREQLLVAAPGAAPRIASYSGRGSLANWVRVSAVRAALKLLRQKGQPVDESQRDRIIEALPATADPELSYIKEHYRTEFADALRAGVAALSSRQRNVLELYFAGSLSTPEIAILYEVNQSTVVRWLAGAREDILSAMRRRLRERLRLSESELDSLLRLVGSQIDVSLKSLLCSSLD